MLRQEKKIALMTMFLLYGVIILLPLVMAESENEWVIFLEQPITILLPTGVMSFFYQKKTQKPFNKIFKFKKLKLNNFLFSTGVLVLTISLVGFSATIFGELFSSANEVRVSNNLLGMRSYHLEEILFFFHSLFFTAVFPGVCEELLFRGSLLHMEEEQGWHKAAIILFNAILFAIFHWRVIQLFHTFVLGLILATLTIATESILSAIYVHTLYNFIIDLSITFDLEQYSFLAIIDGATNKIINFWFALVAAVLLSVMFSLKFRQRKRQ